MRWRWGSPLVAHGPDGVARREDARGLDAADKAAVRHCLSFARSTLSCGLRAAAPRGLAQRPIISNIIHFFSLVFSSSELDRASRPRPLELGSLTSDPGPYSHLITQQNARSPHGFLAVKNVQCRINYRLLFYEEKKTEKHHSWMKSYTV